MQQNVSFTVEMLHSFFTIRIQHDIIRGHLIVIQSISRHMNKTTIKYILKEKSTDFIFVVPFIVILG